MVVQGVEVLVVRAESFRYCGHCKFRPAQSLDYEGECSAADLEIIMVLFSMYLKA